MHKWSVGEKLTTLAAASLLRSAAMAKLVTIFLALLGPVLACATLAGFSLWPGSADGIVALASLRRQSLCFASPG
jgi:hypothetical protein